MPSRTSACCCRTPERDGARTRFALSAAGVLGEGNRWQDYDYFYFQDGSLDANSALTFFASAAFAPTPKLDMRASMKQGFTGSKVERLPSYWASKRNDDAVVVSVQYRVLPRLRVMGEYARYTWGPTRTSAEMLGVDTGAVIKTGYWIGAEVTQPTRPLAGHRREHRARGGRSGRRPDQDPRLARHLRRRRGQDRSDDRHPGLSRRLGPRSHRLLLQHRRESLPLGLRDLPRRGPERLPRRDLNRWGIVVRVRADY